jgi:hypothetical protein
MHTRMENLNVTLFGLKPTIQLTAKQNRKLLTSAVQ